MSLTLDLQFSPIMSDGSDASLPEYIVEIPIGLKYVSYNFSVPLTDTTINLGDLTEVGYCRITNRAETINVSTPDAPLVQFHGDTDMVTWGYKIVAKQADGTYSEASAEGTANGSHTLDGDHYFTMTWPLVSGAVSYDVYRTTADASPSTTGLIGNTTALTFTDDGLPGDSSTPPAVAADNLLLYGHTSGTYPQRLFAGEPAIFRWNGADFADIHVIANTRIIPVEFTLLDN